MKILLIDNYDSFIYNLKYEFELLGEKVTVCRNDIEYTKLKSMAMAHDAIVLSPGPGRPKDSGHCIDLIKELHQHKPILGICLGHQAIIESFAGKVAKARSVMHGKTSSLDLVPTGIFKGIHTPLTVARYHSLSGEEIPQEFLITARSQDTEVMAIRHASLPIYGLQFHPESIMSFQGIDIISNFLGVVEAEQLKQINQQQGEVCNVGH